MRAQHNSRNSNQSTYLIPKTLSCVFQQHRQQQQQPPSYSTTQSQNTLQKEYFTYTNDQPSTHLIKIQSTPLGPKKLDQILVRGSNLCMSSALINTDTDMQGREGSSFRDLQVSVSYIQQSNACQTNPSLSNQNRVFILHMPEIQSQEWKEVVRDIQGGCEGVETPQTDASDMIDSAYLVRGTRKMLHPETIESQHIKSILKPETIISTQQLATYEPVRRQQSCDTSKLTCDKDGQYLMIQQLRDQLHRMETLLKESETQSNHLRTQVRELSFKTSQQNESLQQKDEIISALKSQLNDMQGQNEDNVRNWMQERQQMASAQQQVQVVCSEQLQSFYQLNQRSQEVIEKMEGEVQGLRQELERSNKVIREQHDMYYELYTQIKGQQHTFSFSDQHYEPVKQQFEDSMKQSRGRQYSFGIQNSSILSGAPNIEMMYPSQQKKKAVQSRNNGVKTAKSVGRSYARGGTTKENLIQHIINCK